MPIVRFPTSAVRAGLIAAALLCLVARPVPSQEAAPRGPAAPSAGSASPDASPEKKADVRLAVGGWDDVKKRVAAQRGRVVLVAIWTTTCGACKEELPHFLALQEKFPADKLACVTVACDFDGIAGKPPEFYRARVEKHLATLECRRAEHLLLNVAFPDFLDQMTLKSTPAVFVYGPNGRFVRRFDNDKAARAGEEYTISQVADQVTKLLEDGR